MFSNESLTRLLENLKRNFLAACEASLAYEVFAHPVQRFSTADLGKVVEDATWLNCLPVLGKMGGGRLVR